MFPFSVGTCACRVGRTSPLSKRAAANGVRQSPGFGVLFSGFLIFRARRPKKSPKKK